MCLKLDGMGGRKLEVLFYTGSVPAWMLVGLETAAGGSISYYLYLFILEDRL